MPVSIKQTFKSAGTQQEIELKRFAYAVLADLTGLREAIKGTQTGLDTNGGAGNNYISDYAPPELTVLE